MLRRTFAAESEKERLKSSYINFLHAREGQHPENKDTALLVSILRTHIFYSDTILMLISTCPPALTCVSASHYTAR